MIRIQFLLFALFTLVVFACQSDAVAENAKKSVENTKTVAKKAVETVKATVAEELPKAPAEPKLREFYVEEDKSATKSKKSISKPAATNEEAKADKKEKPVAKKKSPKSSAKMTFANDTYAFGIIKPGDVIEHKFEFTNTGNADLVITDAKATCGCTQPSFPFIPIPPGEKGFIGVKYDSTGKLGSQKPTVTITTNAARKTQKVYLEGVVISKLQDKNKG